MANTISGKVLAISAVTSVSSKVQGKQPTQMRQLWLDCTRFDPYTGERSQYENTPLLDFKGENMKLLDDVKAGDVVTVTFDVNGYKYKDEQGNTKVFTSIRPYQLQKRMPRQQQQQQQQTQNVVNNQQAQENDDLPF